MYTTYLYTAAALAATYFLFIRKRPASTIQVTAPDGQKVWRAAYHPEIISTTEGVTTLYESWVKAVGKFGSSRCFGTRPITKQGKDSKTTEWGPYQWINYKEAKVKSDNFASGLVGLGAKKGDRIGIFSKNRLEWVITQQASHTQALCIVSFYETLGKESIRFVAKHADINIAVCSGETLDILLQVIDGDEGHKTLQNIVVMDKVSDELLKKAKELNVKIHNFEEVEKAGQEKPVKANPPSPSDNATIMYTSGTTGMPKGVPLTHGNMTAAVSATKAAVDVQQEVYLSYLPFAHIFERAIVSSLIHFGGAIGFFHGDTLGLMDDLKMLNPTAFCGVPRIYERIKQGVLKKVEAAPPLKRAVFFSTYYLKYNILKYAPSFYCQIPFLDNLVFGEIRRGLGGKVWVMISAGAPLTREVEIFMRVATGAIVSQAYGLTETTGAASVKRVDDPTVGHIGAAMACNEFKLEDLPEMGYTGRRGELCIRGPNVTAGYYKDEEKTKESFINGWFHTGDIAELTPNGSLRIIDRKKNIFKLAQGEYVAAEKIEGQFDKSDIISQIFVYGNSEKSNLVAVVVPKKSALLSWASSKGLGSDYSKICASKEAREYVLANIKETGKKSNLHGFEIPAGVVLFDEEEGFTVENDMLTPTLKPKRQAIQKNFQKHIDALYNDQDPSKVSAFKSKK